MTDGFWNILWAGYVFPGVLILVHILLLVVPLLVAVAYLTLMERKVLAAMSLRMGPNVVGPFGLLQPLADAAKLRSEEHTSELQSLMRISYAVFCLKKKKKKYNIQHTMSKINTNIQIKNTPQY